MPLLRKDNCRSARIFTDVQGFSVQIFQKFFFRSFWETIYCIFGILQQVFLLTNSQSVESLHRPKFLSRKSFSHHGNFGVWGLFGVGYILQFIHFTSTFQKWFSNLRGSFAILTSFWRMKFDMWQPSGLVEVLIERPVMIKHSHERTRSQHGVGICLVSFLSFILFFRQVAIICFLFIKRTFVLKEKFQFKLLQLQLLIAQSKIRWYERLN